LIHAEKEMDALKILFDQKVQKTEQLLELESNRPKMEALKERINHYEYCLIHFKDLIDREKEILSTQSKKDIALNIKIEQVNALKLELEKIGKTLENVAIEHGKIEHFQIEQSDYEHLMELLDNQAILSKKEALQIKIKAELLRLHQEKMKFEKMELEFKNLISDIKKELSTFNAWADVQSWYVKHESIKKQLDTLYEQEIVLKQRTQRVIDKMPDLVHHELCNKFNYAQLLGTGDFILTLTQQEFDNQSNIKIYQTRLEQLLVQSKLAEFKTQLSDGAACPLCGSLEHPHVMHIDSVEQEIAEIKASIIYNENENNWIRDTLNKFDLAKLELANIDQQASDIREKIEIQQEEETKHLSRFTWLTFSPENRALFDQAQQAMQAKQKELSRLENQLIDLEQNLSKSRERYEIGKEHLNNNETEIKILKSLQNGLKSKIRIVDLNAIDWTIDLAREHWQKVKSHIDQTLEQYQNLNQKIQEIHISLASSESERISLERALAELKTEHSNIQSRFLHIVLQSPFSSIEEIEEVLSSNLNLVELRSDLLLFENEHFSLLKDLTTIEQNLNGRTFDVKQYTDLKQNSINQKKVVDQLNNQIIQEETLFKSLTEQWEIKRELLLTHDYLENRKTNLKTMLNLFKSSGFVNYISSVYLQHLCEAANVRFHQLSRQQLRLEVSENNSFQVRDFLNEGRLRSVKTLSGGQIFQASLCLALAMAESVPQQSKANQNFFFLDEGFGSQDKESLRIVFESLKALRQENRVVGIISHVEDLQQEIDTYLIINNDVENGSRVRGSWE